MSPALSLTKHVNIVVNLPVHHVETGKGELVLLIHGSLCDYRYWRWQMEAFSGYFRVAAISLPGCWPEAVDERVMLATPTRHGSLQSEQNGAPIWDMPFSMERHVQAVVDLCQRLSPDGPIHLVGHSRGAQVALEAALALAGRVGRLVLADPGFPFTSEPVKQAVHAQIAARLGTAPLDDVLAEFIDTVNGPGTWRQTVSWFKNMVRANAWTLVPQMRDIHRGILLESLPQLLHSPLLLVGGEFSPQRYGSRIDALKATLPQARRVIVPQAAHGMNLGNARYFNDAVLKFLLGREA